MEGEGILISPRSALRMRIEKGELSWSKLLFESKIQIDQLFHAWFLKVVWLLGLTKEVVPD